GSTYPEQGGPYVWVRHAFGRKWAARATWYYWVCLPLGMPSLYILFAGIAGQLFIPSLGRAGIIVIGIAMTWLTVLVSIATLEVSKWVPNLGAIFKALIILALGVGGIVFALNHGVANDLSLATLVPSWDTGLAFLPAVVFNFMGFELMSSAGGEMKNPTRDIPGAIIASGLLIAFLYLFATGGILLALPLEQLSLVTGIVDTLQVMLGSSVIGQGLVAVLGIGVLYTLFATMVTWTMGTGRMAARAAKEGTFPVVFGRLHPLYKTPVGAYLTTGTISTLVLILYGLLPTSNDQYFWSLFAFGSIIYLLPYLAIFSAFLKLRHSDPDAARPYRFPGSYWVAWLATLVCMLFVIQAIVFFVWVPGLPLDGLYAIPILIGVVITFIAGELVLAHASKHSPLP
ncbi:MAG TPA: APC family permease, partial [Longilinea sp.]|nr:APC family permease [Longilinea sp.]